MSDFKKVYERSFYDTVTLKVLTVLGDGKPWTLRRIVEATKENPNEVGRRLRALTRTGLVIRTWKGWQATVHGVHVAKTIQPLLFKIYIAALTDKARYLLKKMNVRAPVLLSMGSWWTGSRFSIPFRNRPIYAHELFIDSGGYQLRQYFTGYNFPYKPRDYLESALKLEPDLVATMDVPPSYVTDTKGLSYRLALRITVENTVDLIDEAEKIDGMIKKKIVPVLQGYDDPVQWVECYDMYKDSGIDAETWAIGGVGSDLKRPEFIASVVKNVRKVLGMNKNIHVFGMSPWLARKYYLLINSIDTSLWLHWAGDAGEVKVWSPSRLRLLSFVQAEKYKYDTNDLQIINLKALMDMMEHLNYLKVMRLIYGVKFRLRKDPLALL